MFWNPVKKNEIWTRLVVWGVKKWWRDADRRERRQNTVSQNIKSLDVCSDRNEKWSQTLKKEKHFTLTPRFLIYFIFFLSSDFVSLLFLLFLFCRERHTATTVLVALTKPTLYSSFFLSSRRASLAEVELGGTIVRWPPSVTYLNSAANENFLFKNAFSPYDSVQPHFFSL